MDVRRKISTFGAAAVLAIALGTGGYALASTPTQATADTYTAPVAESVAPPAQDDAAAQSIYDQQIAQAKAEAEAAAAAQAKAEAGAAAAAQAAADAAARKASTPKTVGNPGGLPSGSLVPWIPSPDPVNAPDAGRWDTTACASSSASTGADGKAHCD